MDPKPEGLLPRSISGPKLGYTQGPEGYSRIPSKGVSRATKGLTANPGQEGSGARHPGSTGLYGLKPGILLGTRPPLCLKDPAYSTIGYM